MPSWKEVAPGPLELSSYGSKQGREDKQRSQHETLYKICGGRGKTKSFHRVERYGDLNGAEEVGGRGEQREVLRAVDMVPSVLHLLSAVTTRAGIPGSTS